MSETHPVEVALAGAGAWGMNWARVFSQHPECKFRYCCDMDPGRRQRVGTSYPGVTVTDNFEQMLTDPGLQGLVIATPPPTHYRLARMAIEAGKDVMVEKPLTTSESDARSLVAFAEEHGRILMVGHLLLYHPAVDMLKKLLERGDLGQPYYAYCQRLNLGAIRTEENALWSFAPHDISVIAHLMDGWPAGVTAVGKSYLQKGIEDVAFVNLHYENGFVAHMHMSWLDPNKIRRLTIVGNQKMVVFDDMEPQEKIRIFDKGAQVRSDSVYDNFWSVRYGDTLIPAISNKEPLVSEASEFIQCIRTRRQPKTPGSDGLRVVAVVEATERSMRTEGEYVALPFHQQVT